jgi:chalcone isomerase-like protein
MMKKLGLRAVLGAALLAPLAVYAVEQVGVDGSDRKFDSTITETIGGQQVTMDLTGTALREKAWINVYAIGSYIQQGAAVHNADELAAADVPKSLHLVMERGVGGKKMGSAFSEAIEANYPEPAFAEELKAFQTYFEAHSVEENDPITFTNEPGVGVLCKVAAAEPLEIKNPKFSKAIWDIYLGKNNIGEGVKKGLTSRLK